MKLKRVNKKAIYYLKKTIVLPMIITTTISLASCLDNKDIQGIDDDKKDRRKERTTLSNEIEEKTTKEEISNYESIDIENDKNIENVTENKNFELDEQKYNIVVDLSNVNTDSVIKQIEEMNVNYPYSEYFNTTEALKRYYSMDEYNSNKKLNIITDNGINKNKLLESVLSNNELFLKETKYTYLSELSNSDINSAINAIVDTLNKRIKEDIDLEQLDTNLSNLKIVQSDRCGNASVSNDDTILSINPKAIAALGDKDFFYKVICHESNHLVQINSDIEKKNEKYDRNMGILYVWNDLEINPLEYQWLIEASAEKIMQMETSDKLGKVMYEDMIKDLDSLTLSCIFNDDIDELTIPKITLQPDLDKLFNTFNCKDDNEKQELINMLYTFEIVDDTANDSFDNFYQSKNGEVMDINERYLLSNYCAETLSKYYYKGLITKLKTNSTNLYDVFNLMAVNEADMNRITRFHGCNSNEQKEFITYYNKIQGNMFSLLSESTNIEKDELYYMYDTYYDYKTNYNYESNLLNDNQKVILQNIIETRNQIKPDDNLYTYVNK